MPEIVENYQNLILICNSCGPNLESQMTLKDIESHIKAFMSTKNIKTLILRSNCLGICPQFGITIGYKLKNDHNINMVVINYQSELTKILELFN